LSELPEVRVVGVTVVARVPVTGVPEDPDTVGSVGSGVVVVTVRVLYPARVQ
jgi:hypothetical protein